MVVVQTTSCAAAALCRNTRYVSNEAPRLPLPNCSNPAECPCTFRHFEDRRAGDLGARGDQPKSEKRKIRGRRARDKT